MRSVVIDTNIFVSALNKADTPPRAIFRLCFQRRIQPLMGEALFAEYNELLGREHLFASCPFNQAERQQFFADFCTVCKWVSVYYLWRPNLTDEADNHLIELAMAGNAGHIITGNTKDLIKGELIFPAVHIHTPRQFLNETQEA